MNVNPSVLTIDPVSPEAIEAGMARGRKERAIAFRDILGGIGRSLSQVFGARHVTNGARQQMPVPY